MPRLSCETSIQVATRVPGTAIFLAGTPDGTPAALTHNFKHNKIIHKRVVLLTILIEIPILVFGLSSSHPLRRRLIAGCWLTACTYPVVILVLPLTVGVHWGHVAYLIVAETFAPVAECLLFRAAFQIPTSRPAAIRDMATIVTANVASFVVGLCIYG